MKLILILTILSQFSWAQFYLGKADKKTGVQVTSKESPFELRLGTRFQGMMDIVTTENKGGSVDFTAQDFSARRVRFEVNAKYSDKFSYKMDIRNDNVNEEDRGEQGFNVGDAAFTYKFNQSGVHKSHLKFYRAKVDMSRSQTASSANTTYLIRAASADEAASFVNENRRAMNIQLNGHLWDHKLSYHAVMGDGVKSDDIGDLNGQNANAVVRQNFMWGGKVRLSPFDGWEDKKITETYHGYGKHISLGAGYFSTSNINFEFNNQQHQLDRNLLNAEFSMHYYGFSMIAEYFAFDGVHRDLSAAPDETGKANSYYVSTEYVFKEHSFLAPYFRYESWEQHEDVNDSTYTSTVVGLNWYALANKIRFGAFLQQNDYEAAIGNQDEQIIRLVAMFHI